MKQNRIARIGATLAVSMSLVLPASAIALTPDVAGPPADVNAEALQRVGACIAGGGQGDMLLLIDRSGSLQKTDPKGNRADAAKYLVRQMAAFVDSTKAQIQLAVAGFDATYSKTADWVKLSSATLPQVETSIEALRDQNRGLDTDYWNALNGARRDLAERASSGGSHCSFLVWFTDGEYDVEPRGGRSDEERRALGDPKPYLQGSSITTAAEADAAVAAGLQDVCRPGGVADQLRSQKIVNIAVGLGVGAASPDFTKLRAIATGAEGSCGAVVRPAPGAFFLVSDIDSLYFAFDQFATPGRSPLTQTGAVCGPEVCAAGTHRFVLDPSIGSAHVLGASSAKDQQVLLLSPAGAKVELGKGATGGSATVPGATVEWRWVSDQTVSFDLRRASDQDWTGPWSLAFLSQSSAAGSSRSSLHIFGDLVPMWREATGMARVGDQLTMTLAIGHADGSIVDPGSLTPETTLSAELVTPDGASTVIADNLPPKLTANPTGLDLTTATPGQVRVRLKLVVTTKSWSSPSGAQVPGTTLEPQVKDYLVTIQAPATYPVVPSSVDFGHTTTKDPVQASLPIQGEGCVWLGDVPAPVTLPQGVSAATVTSSAKDQGSCVVGSLPLSIAPSDIGNGLVSGILRVVTASKDAGAKPIPVPVTYQLDMARPANTTVLVIALVGITLLGVAIPLGLIYLVKFLTAKIPGESIKAGSVRGPVDDTRSFLSDGLALDPTTLKTEFLSGDRRRVSVAGCSLCAKTGLALTEPGYVLVEQAGSPAGSGREAARKGTQARLPLAVQGNWCVSLDAADPWHGDVQVTFFTAAGASGWDDLIDDARSGVQEAVLTLRRGLPQETNPAGTSSGSPGSADGWGGPGGSASADAWSSPAAQVGDPWGTSGASTPTLPTATAPPNAPSATQASGPGEPTSPASW